MAILLLQTLLDKVGITDISLGLFESDSAQAKQEAYHGYTIWAIALIVFVRIAVSMLPDDDEPLVPLDDSLKRSRRIGASDAWKSSVYTYVHGSGEFMAEHLLQELSFSCWGNVHFGLSRICFPSPSSVKYMTALCPVYMLVLLCLCLGLLGLPIKECSERCSLLSVAMKTTIHSSFVVYWNQTETSYTISIS